jgi:prepilin-type N-terminal cleavage/methylation domain-containing protein/prepilin-type processing-associated H-X9-DG protein
MLRRRAGFTLIELLVVIAIIAILAALVFVLGPGIMQRGRATASLNNLRQIGTGVQLYANDHEFTLPGRVRSSDKWPTLLLEYLKDTKVYADPGDETNYLLRKADPLSNGNNNTSYVLNGYNDVGAYNDETVQVRTNVLDKPSQTILLAIQNGHDNFYMDFEEGNQNTAFKKKVYGDGSNYMFADGSARFIKATDYDDWLWYVRKPPKIPQ